MVRSDVENNSQIYLGKREVLEQKVCILCMWYKFIEFSVHSLVV